MPEEDRYKKRSRFLSPPILYGVMIAFGVFVGLSDYPLLKALGVFFSDVFIRIFKCISLPIIALSIIVTLSNYRSDNGMRTIWRRTLCYTLGTTIVAAIVSFALYCLIQPALIETAQHTIAELPQSMKAISYFQHIEELIPLNIIAPFLDNKVICE